MGAQIERHLQRHQQQQTRRRRMQGHHQESAAQYGEVHHDDSSVGLFHELLQTGAFVFAVENVIGHERNSMAHGQAKDRPAQRG